MATSSAPEKATTPDPGEIMSMKAAIQGKNAHIWLGRTGTSSYDIEKDTKSDIFRRTDALLTALGVIPSTWVSACTRTTLPVLHGADFLKEEKQILGRNPMQLGKYLVDRAVAELPIESYEDGDASWEVELTVPHHTVVLSAEGNYWTEYIYEKLSADDVRNLEKLNMDGVDPDFSEAHYTVEVQAEIYPRP